MKRIMITLFAMLTSIGSIFAEDKFSVADISLAPDQEGTLTIQYSLDEGKTCSGYGFWLRIPKELEFVLDSQGNPAYILGNVYDDAPNITSSFDDGFLKVVCLICLDPDTKPVTTPSGTLLSFKVKVKDGVTVNPGETLKAWLVREFISEENGSSHSVEDLTFQIAVQNFLLGDASGDGKVDMNDALCILNYLMGNPPADFNEAAADVNGDGVVDIADAVQIVNMIIGK